MDSLMVLMFLLVGNIVKMVKLTGDFHSVYYRTKDSIDDINKITKLFENDVVLQHVEQKPNYLRLILSENLDFKQQSRLKNLVNKKYGMSKVYKDKDCKYAINLWYKNRLGDNDGKERKQVSSIDVWEKNMKIFIPEKYKTKSANYPELLVVSNEVGGIKEHSFDNRVELMPIPIGTNGRNYDGKSSPDVDFNVNVQISLVEGGNNYGHYYLEGTNLEKRIDRKEFLGLFKRDEIFKGHYYLEGTNLENSKLSWYGNDFNDYRYDAILCYDNALCLGSFREIGFPTHVIDNNVFKTKCSYPDEHDVRDNVKFPKEADEIMVSLDTEYNGQLSPMIALKSKDMLVEMLKLNKKWEERNIPNIKEINFLNLYREKLGIYLDDNVSLNMMEEAQKTLGKKWEIIDCTNMDCNSKWCLNIEYKGKMN